MKKYLLWTKNKWISGISGIFVKKFNPRLQMLDKWPGNLKYML